MATFGNLVLRFIVGFGLTLFGGVVLCDLWRWFVSPLGVPNLMYWQAIGLMILVGMMRSLRAIDVLKSMKADSGELSRAMWITHFISFLITLVSWALGGIVVRIMS